jgi:small subunit ribosomal protein S2
MAMSEENCPKLSVRDLLDAGLHFGHQTKRWNPKMKRYIFDKRNGIHIIDLTQSVKQLEAAVDFVYNITVTGKTILFVGTKKQAQQVIKDAAVGSNQPYVTMRWLGGTLTNSITIRKSVKRMRELEALEKNNQFAASRTWWSSRALFSWWISAAKPLPSRRPRSSASP